MLTALAILIGFVLVAVSGIAHHHALHALRRLAPPAEAGSRAIQGTFVTLLALHVAEIIAFSAVNGALLTWDLFAGAAGAPLGWGDVIYLTGVSFTTLGYARIELAGDLRFLIMLQSLAGFMLLTWSATYLYSVCQKTWRESEGE